MSKLFDFKENIDDSKIKECALAIKKGKTVVFPTETVYGIGANALSKDAVDKIFKAKGRPIDNPLIVHISNIDMLDGLVEDINNIEKKLMSAFWPGPFTIILKKKSYLPDNVTAGLDTVGIRMPSDKIALELIREAGVPIAAPSANISGKPSGTNIQDIFEELKDRVDYILDGGNCDIGIESTVVKVTSNKVKILRPGKISKEDIEKLGLEVLLDDHIFNDVNKDELVESPGMKHRHYSPNTKTMLIYSINDKSMILKINEIIDNNNDKKICVIGFNEHKASINSKEYIEMGSKNNLENVSKNIFTSLRKVDKLNCDLCLIEGVVKNGVGAAIMNRLIRACEHSVIYVD